MSDAQFARFLIAVEELLNDHIQNKRLEVEIISRPNHTARVHLRIMPIDVEVMDDMSAKSRKAAGRTASGKAAG